MGMTFLGGCLADGYLDLSVEQLRERGGHVVFVAGTDEVIVEFDDFVETLDACVRLNEDVTGTVGGVAMTVLRGGADDNRECLRPRMRLERPPQSPLADFVLSDGDTSIACSLGDAVAERGPVLVSPDGWDLARGQRVTVQWAPANDLDTRTLGVMLRPVEATPGVPKVLDISVGARGMVTFEIPSNVFPGAHDLVFGIHDKDDGGSQLACALYATMYVSSDTLQPVRITP